MRSTASVSAGKSCSTTSHTAPRSTPRYPCTITLRNPESSRQGIWGSVPLMSPDNRWLDSAKVCRLRRRRLAPAATCRIGYVRRSCTRQSGPGSRACAPAARGRPRGLVSQRYGACHHALAQRRVQARFGDDIYTAAQQLLCIQQQAAQGKAAGPWGKGHQEINVTVVAAVATAHRAEDPNTRDATSACQCQQFGAVGLDQRMHAKECSQPAPAGTYRPTRHGGEHRPDIFMSGSKGLETSKPQRDRLLRATTVAPNASTASAPVCGSGTEAVTSPVRPFATAPEGGNDYRHSCATIMIEVFKNS